MQRLNDITKTSRRGEEKYFYRKEEEKENFRRKIRVIIAMLRRRTGGGSGITSRSCTSWLRQTSEDRVFPPREIIILDGSESGKICRVYSLLHCRSFLLSTNSVFLNLPFPALRFFNNNPNIVSSFKSTVYRSSKSNQISSSSKRYKLVTFIQLFIYISGSTRSLI